MRIANEDSLNVRFIEQPLQGVRIGRRRAERNQKRSRSERSNYFCPD
jgi:hypothetical protein